MSTKPVCLITGVGDATGAAVARRFSEAGYAVVMVARNGDRLRALERELPDSRHYVCDVGDIDQLLSVLGRVKAELGDPEVVIHNAVAHTFDTFMDADPSDLERNFRVNTTALLYLARELTPAMVARGKGALIVTGNTASHRGVANYALFAPTKAAQRVLAESLARDLGPKRVHVAYVTVDAAIPVTWLGGPGERPAWLEPPPDWDKPREDYFAAPAAIAEEIFHVAHQHQTTWSFDLVIRPYAEKW